MDMSGPLSSFGSAYGQLLLLCMLMEMGPQFQRDLFQSTNTTAV